MEDSIGCLTQKSKHRIYDNNEIHYPHSTILASHGL